MKKAANEKAPLSEECHVCKRVRWGNFVVIGNGQWRHEECWPGSRAWREAFEALPESQRTEEAKIIYRHRLT